MTAIAIVALGAQSEPASAGTQLPTSTLVFADDGSVRYGTAFGLTVAVTSDGSSSNPSGQVTIWRSGDGQASFSPVATLTLTPSGTESGVATFEQAGTLPPGVYHYYASYGGEPSDPDPAVDHYGPSQSEVANGSAGITVRAASITTLSASTSVAVGDDVVLEATVAVEPAGSVAADGTIEFRRGGQLIGSAEVSSNVVRHVDPAPPLGPHSYTARFVSSQPLLLSSTSPARSTEVVPATTTTSSSTTTTSSSTTTTTATIASTTSAVALNSTTTGPPASTTTEPPTGGSGTRPTTPPISPTSATIASDATSVTTTTVTAATTTGPTTTAAATTTTGASTTTSTTTATSTTTSTTTTTAATTVSAPTTPRGPPTTTNTSDASEGPRRSALVSSIPTARQIDWAPAQIATGCVLALLVILLLEIPSAIFNHTLRNNYERVITTFGVVAAKWQRIDRVLIRLPNSLLLIGFGAISALASATLDARLRLDVTSAVLVAAMFVSFSVITAINEVLRIPLLRRITGQTGHLRLFPLGFAIGTVLVTVSRLAEIHPGYVFGMTTSLLFVSPVSEADEARSNIMTGATLLSVAVLAWVAWQPISGRAADPGAGLALVFVDAVLSTMWLSALQVLLFQFSGLAGMKGAPIRRRHRGAWLAIYGASAFMLVKMVLSPRAWRWGALTSAGFVATMIGFVGFTAAAVAFRIWARRPLAAIARSGRSVTT